jgi:hypothetical protein
MNVTFIGIFGDERGIHHFRRRPSRRQGEFDFDLGANPSIG